MRFSSYMFLKYDLIYYVMRHYNKIILGLIEKCHEINIFDGRLLKYLKIIVLNVTSAVIV